MLLGMSVMILPSCDGEKEIPVNKKYKYVYISHSALLTRGIELGRRPTKEVKITKVGDSIIITTGNIQSIVSNGVIVLKYSN